MTNIDNMAEQSLREVATKLLTEGRVGMVIGYGSLAGGEIAPVFITDPNDASRLVWNDRCVHNLTTYLHRAEVRVIIGEKSVAIVVKGCDAKSLAVLEAESQIVRERLVVLGMACDGCVEPTSGQPLARCGVCDVHQPQHTDQVFGVAAKESNTASADERYAAVREFMKRPREDRQAYWKRELARCIKCYACRQVCPLCYCQQCIVDKNRPQRLDTSPHLKGNVAWNVTRAFHLAGRCTQCGSCGTVCPVGINLGLLNATLAQAAEEHFDGYRSGYDPKTLPVIGTFSENDQEAFIR